MKLLTHILATLLLAGATVFIPAYANRTTTKQHPDTTILQKWDAGKQVSDDAVKAYGAERCFTVSKIDDATFKRIYGKSYKKNCRVPRSELRYLRVLHRTLDGHTQLGEIVCNQAIANDLITIFRQLYQAHYPIERMLLIDEYGAQDEPSMTANNTTCFNYRTVAGSSKLSAHSQGLAIDINPLYNPYVKVRNGRTVVQPEAGRTYANRTRDFNYKITTSDLCYKLFRQHGFIWGGSWRTLKDYQHFEKAK